MDASSVNISGRTPTGCLEMQKTWQIESHLIESNIYCNLVVSLVVNPEWFFFFSKEYEIQILACSEFLSLLSFPLESANHIFPYDMRDRLRLLSRFFFFFWYIHQLQGTVKKDIWKSTSRYCFLLIWLWSSKKIRVGFSGNHSSRTELKVEFRS